MNATDAVFYIAILIMSVVVHEFAHGYVAFRYGDKTAQYAGRLTLNPLPHLDLFGSVIIPALLYFSTGFAIGWAKPVPYNPDNLSDKKWGSVAVAAAGVLANILIAVIFSLVLRLGQGFTLQENFSSIVSSIIVINLALAIFNLVPIPPLDGSKIFYPFLPKVLNPLLSFVEQYSLILLIAFIYFLSKYISLAVMISYMFLTGVGLR